MWDGIKRRADDMRGESPEITLARIDENVQFLKTGAEVNRIALEEHKINDDKRFKEMGDNQNKTNALVLIASGGLAVVVFFINLFFKH